MGNPPVEKVVEDLFRSAAGAEVVQAAEILAVALSCAPSELEKALTQLIGLDSDVSGAVVRELGTWPFVLSFGSNWQIAPGMDVALAGAFRRANETMYIASHRLFADWEEEKVKTTVGTVDSWAARSRYAYYLAPFNERASLRGFSRAFEQAPETDRTDSRLWLGELVWRQRDTFGTDSRIVSFYRGFQFYVAGKHLEAQREFEQVTMRPPHDSYEAIALHLGALCAKVRDSDDAVADLRSSIGRSESLKLIVNEIMARHSLCWMFVRRASSGRLAHELGESNNLAVRNLERLKLVSNDKGLECWVLRTAAVCGWLTMVGRNRSVANKYGRVVVFGIGNTATQ